MPRLPRAAAALALGATLALTGCVATGPGPEEAIPPALLASDLGILESEAGQSLDGFSVGVWAQFVVERDELSADDLRDVLAIVVDNTHISNVKELTIYAESDETSLETPVRVDLSGAVGELGLVAEITDRGALEARWEDVIAMLEATR